MNTKKSIFYLFLGISTYALAMDRPDGWSPSRPSTSGRSSRPRPQAINYGAAPQLDAQGQPAATPAPAATQTVPPAYAHAPNVPAVNFFMNPIPAANPQTPVTNPMHIINLQPIDPALVQAQLGAPGFVATPKERDRLRKIEKDLDKIEEILKEMGIDLALTAVSAISLDPITVAFSASGALINIPKLAYYYGNMQKHIFFLSSSDTSPAAKARLKQLAPRLQTVSRVIAKGPEKLHKLIRAFSKEDPKEAK